MNHALLALIVLSWAVTLLLVACLYRLAFGTPWRRMLFGWICLLRGQHVAKQPSSIIPLCTMDPTFNRLRAVFGHNVTFHCICGEHKHMTVDTKHGGRIPVPFAWPTERCL